MCEDKGSRTWVYWESKLRSPFSLSSFWGFTSRNFTMYEDEGPCTWVSQEPETPKSIYTMLFLGFRKSGFHDVRRRGVSHLGFPRSQNSEAHLIRDRGKVKSQIYYNGSLSRGSLRLWNARELSQKKGCLREDKPGDSTS
jgi:hypothetical protein